MANLTDFGAIANGRQLYPVAVEQGSDLLQAAPGSFTEEDSGKFIVIAGAGINGTKLFTIIHAVVDDTTVELMDTVSTTQAGTGASLGTDCSVALQAAFDELVNIGGGELVIDGVFLLTSPVYKNFHTLASSVVLRGTGSNSALLIACGQNESAITFGNLIKLNVKNIDFVGTPSERNDAEFVLDFQACLSVDLEDNSFYGLSNVDGIGTAVVNNHGGGLSLVRNTFGGCIIADGGVVLNEFWQRFSSEGNRFIDFGQRNGLLHSKTWLATGTAWIKVGESVPSSTYELTTGPRPLYPHTTVRIVGDFYDEGTKNPVLISSTVSTKRIAGVYICGCRFNVNGYILGSTGPAILFVNDVIIEHCSIGYHNGSRFTIYLNTVKHARITGVTNNGYVSMLKAYTMDWLEVVNCPGMIISPTGVTRQTVDGLPAV